MLERAAKHLHRKTKETLAQLIIPVYIFSDVKPLTNYLYGSAYIENIVSKPMYVLTANTTQKHTHTHTMRSAPISVEYNNAF